MGRDHPQFLFAEPSYIGMHLFGVLLPLMWLMRGLCQAVAQLIVVYAIGAVLMQAGTRIVLARIYQVLIRYAGCSPIRGRCLPDMRRQHHQRGMGRRAARGTIVE